MSAPAATSSADNIAPLKASAELRFAIPSTPAALSAAVRMIRSTMEWMALKQDWVFRAELCLHEALLNAHFHGNEANSAREIRVGCLLASDKVEMDVEDDGAGYAAGQAAVVRRTGEPHGRGLYLIRQFMNSVAVYGNGTRIVMSLNKE